MIKANELRIGNWVIGANNEPIEIEGSHINDRNFTLNATPIPLTEDWLSSFKDTEFNIGKWWIGIRLAIELWSEDEYLVYFVDKHSATTSLYIKIQYVHQLQNLYFDFNGGDELTII